MDAIGTAARLRREGTAFVLATVVRAERPTSARPGAKAIITADGALVGFVGGSCVQPAVRREALRALSDGSSRLLRITPEGPAADRAPEEGVLDEAMPCVSGGALDIHIEPYLPSRRLLLAGDSPIVEALSALGEAFGMEVRRAENEADLAEAAKGAFVVVAGHGEGEWEALRAGLEGGHARYAGLVASPRRAASVRERLAAMGVPPEDLPRLRSPAGLDIGAATAGEIALSILAQIVEEGRASRPAEAVGEEADDEASATDPAPPTSAVPAPPASQPVAVSLEPAPDAAAQLAVDPVCGMNVSRDSPHRVEKEGETFFFCCPMCAETFAATAPSHPQ